MTVSRGRSVLTLILSTILHAFTHIFGSMLVPLYLLMATDLHLTGVREARIDRHHLRPRLQPQLLSRRAARRSLRPQISLLAIGLLGNALSPSARMWPFALPLPRADHPRHPCKDFSAPSSHPTANALGPLSFSQQPRPRHRAARHRQRHRLFRWPPIRRVARPIRPLALCSRRQLATSLYRTRHRRHLLRRNLFSLRLRNPNQA